MIAQITLYVVAVGMIIFGYLVIRANDLDEKNKK